MKLFGVVFLIWMCFSCSTDNTKKIKLDLPILSIDLSLIDATAQEFAPRPSDDNSFYQKFKSSKIHAQSKVQLSKYGGTSLAPSQKENSTVLSLP